MGLFDFLFKKELLPEEARTFLETQEKELDKGTDIKGLNEYKQKIRAYEVYLTLYKNRFDISKEKKKLKHYRTRMGVVKKESDASKEQGCAKVKGVDLSDLTRD